MNDAFLKAGRGTGHRRPQLRSLRILALAPLLAAVVVWTGCSRQEAPPTPAGPQGPAPQPAPQPASPTAQGEVKRVTIEANDMMKFSVTEFSVSPRQQVEVTLKNAGSMPKISMGHNWVLLKVNADPSAFVEAGFDDAGNDYIDPGKKGDMIASTKLLGPGESDTVTFTAPEQAGKYNYLCTFPGHFAAGMKGIMTVQ